MHVKYLWCKKYYQVIQVRYRIHIQTQHVGPSDVYGIQTKETHKRSRGNKIDFTGALGAGGDENRRESDGEEGMKEESKGRDWNSRAFGEQYRKPV